MKPAPSRAFLDHSARKAIVHMIARLLAAFAVAVTGPYLPTDALSAISTSRAVTAALPDNESAYSVLPGAVIDVVDPLLRSPQYDRTVAPAVAVSTLGAR